MIIYDKDLDLLTVIEYLQESHKSNERVSKRFINQVLKTALHSKDFEISFNAYDKNKYHIIYDKENKFYFALCLSISQFMHDVILCNSYISFSDAVCALTEIMRIDAQ